MHRCIDHVTSDRARAFANAVNGALARDIDFARREERPPRFTGSPGEKSSSSLSSTPSTPLFPVVDYITDKKIAAPGPPVVSIARLDRMFQDFSDNGGRTRCRNRLRINRFALAIASPRDEGGRGGEYSASSISIRSLNGRSLRGYRPNRSFLYGFLRRSRSFQWKRRPLLRNT